MLLQSTAAFASDVTTYTYDEARPGTFNVGELTTVSNNAATIRYDHDALGNVTTKSWEVDGQTYTQSFTYAPHGELLRWTFADGDVIPSASGTAQYDVFGNLKSLPGLIEDISYNSAFQPVATVYANGVTETRTYDPDRQWLTAITATAGASTLLSESYSRNDRGLIAEVTSNRPDSNWQYSYDTVDRLSSAANLDNADYTQTFQYDAADNVTYNSAVGSYIYPAPTAPRPHAVTQAGNQTYAYDGNGNMTSGAGRTITYDGENRPVFITKGGVTTAFIYGPDGRRLKKTTAGNTTLYLGPDEEITPDSVHIKHPLPDVRIADSEKSWLHRDHLNSVKLVSGATGTVIAENLFRPYGERTDVQALAGQPRVSKGWIGERDDPETGLIYLNARYYDPFLSRFLSPDWYSPKHRSVGTNRYAYGLNNPILYKDPTGHYARDDVTELDTIYVGDNDPVTDSNPRGKAGSTCGGNDCGRGAGGEGSGGGSKEVQVAFAQAAIPFVVGCFASSACEAALYGATTGALFGWILFNEVDDDGKNKDRPRGLPPEGISPPVQNPDKVTVGEPSRKKPRERGEKSLWDEDNGEFRYFPEDEHHNPHWDYNAHDKKGSPWVNIPIDGKPPVKGN
ncbi:hypothetical protein OA90_27125 [Labrenzia sp. OB1]|nr:hypothetical protein OA90_27125 [Labrenzia sp. OB1]